MKLYASIHGVCGLAEGYSDTTVAFFKTLDEALEHKARLLKTITKSPFEEVISQADGLGDIIVINDDESEHEMLKVVEIEPMYDSTSGIYFREWFVWDQMDNEPYCDGYLPSDMGSVRTALEAIEFRAPLPGRGRARTFDLDVFKDFFNDLWYNSQSTLDCDDLCLHFFRIPKLETLKNNK